MSSANGKIFFKASAFALFMLLILPQKLICQSHNILDSTYTFSSGSVKTHKTGYNFTYDSRLINQERKTEMNFSKTMLRVILDSILKNDSLVYSVINKYIIISHREPPPPTHPADSATSAIHYITGKIIDEENSQPLSVSYL